MADERWLIVGLGNPGPGYAGNRHNAGYLVADEIASRIGGRFKAGKFRSSIAEGRLDGTPVTVAKPLTYMNESGGPVAGTPRLLPAWTRTISSSSTTSWICRSARSGSSWAAGTTGTTGSAR